MKKFLRIVALATLSLYVGLVMTETFHSLCRHHNESQCVVCQVVHQTPVIGQGRPTGVQNSENFRRVVSKNAPIILAETEKVSLGRSPPASNS